MASRNSLEDELFSTTPAARFVGVGAERMRQIDGIEIESIRTSTGQRLFRLSDLKKLRVQRQAKAAEKLATRLEGK